jgi:hypothetical protein
VLVGVANRSTAFLNASSTYLFTDFEIAVQEWLTAGNDARSIAASAFGGRVLLGGRLLETANEASPLPRVGEEHVFFLQRISRTDSTEGYAMFPRPAALTPRVRAADAAAGNAARQALIDDVRQLLRTCQR